MLAAKEGVTVTLRANADDINSVTPSAKGVMVVLGAYLKAAKIVMVALGANADDINGVTPHSIRQSGEEWYHGGTRGIIYGATLLMRQSQKWR